MKFLSHNQLDLIAAAEEKPLDLLRCNVLTVSALAARGLAEISVPPGKHAVVRLTVLGKAFAKRLNAFLAAPAFRDVRQTATIQKKAEKKWSSSS